MSSVMESAVPTTSPELSCLEMTFECGVMAGRFAELLRRRFSADESSVAASLGFLDYHYGEIAAGRSLSENRAMLARRRQLITEQPFDRLRRALGLNELEQDLLVFAGLAEHHEGYADIFRSLHPSSLPFPTFGLAAQLLGTTEQRQDVGEMLARGALFNKRLLSLQGDVPVYARYLLVAEALWAVLQGLDAWPQGMGPEPVTAVLAGLDEWLAQGEIVRARHVLAAGTPSTVVMSADSGSVAWQRALSLVEAAGVTAVPFSWPLKATADFEMLLSVHLLARAAIPVVRLVTGDNEAPQSAPCPMLNFPAPVVVCSHVGLAMTVRERPILNLIVEALKAPALRDMWRAVLPALADQANRLAARYPLEPGQALQVAQDLALGSDGSAPTLKDVAESLRARAAMSLGGGVQLVRPVAGWSQLVLPDSQASQLREAVNRLDLQGRVLDDWQFLAGRRGARGVRMLFSGPPGTGKTLSAEVLAKALNVDLLLVDLSQVVSKWIGETEKNLAEVFATAERAKAVLFFDEAESLFGKRTEVSDSHDRYANLETAYLLSRLERFDGLAILATNLRQNIDAAFSRRLEYIIEYEEPGLAQRLALWQCHIPAGVPLADDVNLQTLAANYPVVGGLIRNATVTGAFMAAADGQVITQEHFTRAIRREYEKAGKAFRERPGRHGISGHKPLSTGG
jgi:hypothetical protein